MGKEITKATLARTQQTSAKKKPAKKKPAKKKAAKKPKKKKAKKKKAKKKKKKKKKKKVVKYPGGKRPKGVHKSKASIAAGKKSAAAMKKKGVGLFATKTLSADLAAVCGKTKMSRLEVTKALWGYIKKNKPRFYGTEPGPSHGRPQEGEAWPVPLRSQQDPPRTRLRALA